ncbi:9639_t:CDS:2, partial [Entrophospora sp. SA101]
PTNKIMKYWLQTPDEIPERHQLTYFLNKIPNVKIPLSKENFSSIPVIGPFSIDPTERDKYFVESKSESYTPYLFGYYANTTAVTFCVLYINEKEPININSRKRKCPDICSERLAEFDLNKLTHRFKLMNLIRNICCILPMIINMCPSKELPDFETIIRDNGTNIEIGYDIKKTFPSEAKVKHLENFYGLMSNYKIKCIDKLIRSRDNVVHLMPRGKEKKPKNLNELLRAIICILTCLEGLHNIKPNPVMHRDIRWPNVIQYEDQYILIDFDFASFSPSNENLQNLNPDNHAPEMLIGVHDVTVDIWGVGYLIVSSGINELPEELLSLSQSMCQENINLRPNAFDTLKVVKGFFVK